MKTDILITIINKMFELSGHDVSYDDIKDRTDDWYTQWTMTEEQHDEWILWGTRYLSRELRLPERYARTQMGWITACYGLKVNYNLNV